LAHNSNLVHADREHKPMSGQKGEMMQNPSHNGLTEAAELIYRRVRKLDQAGGCVATMRQLGRGSRKTISERQTRRIVAQLKRLGLIVDGGRIPGGPCILHARPLQERAA
jgi:hypothetical protein